MSALRHVGAGALAGGLPLAGVILGKAVATWAIAHPDEARQWAWWLTVVIVTVAAAWVGDRS